MGDGMGLNLIPRCSRGYEYVHARIFNTGYRGVSSFYSYFIAVVVVLSLISNAVYTTHSFAATRLSKDLEDWITQMKSDKKVWKPNTKVDLWTPPEEELEELYPYQIVADKRREEEIKKWEEEHG